MAYEGVKDADLRRELQRSLQGVAKGQPHGHYAYVDVEFDTANQDVDIRHALRPTNPEGVRYAVIRQSGGAVVYQDLSGTRKAWRDGLIYLRATAATTARILLWVEPEETGSLLTGLPHVVPVTTTSGTTTTTTDSGLVFIIDGSGSALTTGVKGFVALPFDATLTKYTLLSSDAAATAGDIVLDIRKVAYSSYPPGASHSIVAAAPPTLSATNKTEDTGLVGWDKALYTDDVLGFSITSVSTLTRVTLTLHLTKTS